MRASALHCGLLLAAVSIGAASLMGQGMEEPIDPRPSQGPYSASIGDQNNPFDAPIPGFIGPDGVGKANLQTGVDIDGNPTYIHGNNYVNPVFQGWATSVVEYRPAPGVATTWQMAAKALGPVTGDPFDVVSLGELYSPANAPVAGSFPPYLSVGDPARIPYSGNLADPHDGFAFIGYDAPGSITLGFSVAITNGIGADFAVFENGFTSNYTTGAGSVAGQLFGELAYVEVSTNGTDFARFPSVSLTEEAIGQYGTFDPSNVFNLAGKHTNAYGESWGTPFDLELLLSDASALALIQAGLLDIYEIHFVRIVDIPGNGFYKDAQGNPIYDAWYTFGSGGFDLEAIGALHVVPEPSSALLLLLASVGLTSCRWRG